MKKKYSLSSLYKDEDYWTGNMFLNVPDEVEKLLKIYFENGMG